jgi:NADH-quinone oxidoreductase subunit J
VTLTFVILALLTVAGAVAAMSLRNLVHCALALVVSFAGLAAIYLQLGAQFVGFAQILVYIGAVAILIVFAILLTRGGQAPEQAVFSGSWLSGIVVTVAVLGVLIWCVARSVVNRATPTPKPDVTVQKIGDALMHKFVLPLEVIGLLLTVALIGAVIIAMKDERK